MQHGIGTRIALALLCASLLVNNGFIILQTDARALEDPLLPPVVATEGDTSSSESVASLPADKPSAAVPSNAVAEPSASDVSPKDSVSNVADGKELKKETPVEEVSKSSAFKPNESKQDNETSQNSPTAANEADTKVQEKDLKSLLENKNDAENDLASLPTTTTSVSDSKKGSDDVPVSVLSDSDRPNADNDRFHYSLGGSDSNKSSDNNDNKDSAPAKDDSLDKRGDDSKPDSTSGSDKRGSELPLNPDTDVYSDGDKVKESVQTTTKESTIVTTLKPIEDNKNEKPLEVTPVEVKQDKVLTETSSSTASSKDSETKEDEIKEVTSGSGSTTGENPTVEADLPAQDSRPTTEQPTAPESTTTAEPASSPASSTKSSISTTTTTTATKEPAAPSKDVDSKPASEAPEQPPAAAAAPPASLVPAAAAAAGAAAGSALAEFAGKDKPVAKPVSSSTSPTSTTTKAPTTTSTTRKSTSNRWNSWSTTTSTSPPPPTRRRQILPSIRRRFRPYNVFPWAMPESYSPLEPVDTEPDFGPSTSEPPTTSTSKPKRRSSTTTTTSQPSATKTTSVAPKDLTDESDDDASTVSTRRRLPDSNNKRRNHHHHHHNHHHRHHNRDHHNRRDSYNPDNDSPLWSGGDAFGSPPKRQFEDNPRPSHHGSRPARPTTTTNHGPRRNKHNDNPFSAGPGLEPFSPPFRPHTAPGFGLFNSAAGSPSSSPGSGFDLLNPFSWIDEVTKPRPPLHNHQRPPLSGSGVGGGHDQSSFRPTPSHIGTAARPSGHRPVAFEGEFNEPATGFGPGAGHNGEHDRPHRHDHDHHDHHHDHHRPLGSRPIGHGGRDREDYDDYHDCHGHGNHGNHGNHGHDHDHDHDHNQDRPYRPPHRPARPGRGDYDQDSYGDGRPLRPGRPYNRRDDSSNSDEAGRETEASPTRNRESTRSGSPSAGAGERLESGSSSTATPGTNPRRVPSSMFSPFDTLFGSLDDDLFGGLRSSFIDSPLKAAAETIRQTNNAAFDAIISSPKISLPSNDQTAPAAANAPKPQITSGEPQQNARVIMAKVDNNEPLVESTGKPQVSSGSERKSAIRELFDRIESLRTRRDQLLNDNNNNTSDQSIEIEPKPTAPSAAENTQQHNQHRVELPAPIATLRGGIKHFLLMI